MVDLSIPGADAAARADAGAKAAAAAAAQLGLTAETRWETVGKRYGKVGKRWILRFEVSELLVFLRLIMDINQISPRRQFQTVFTNREKSVFVPLLTSFGLLNSEETGAMSLMATLVALRKLHRDHLQCASSALHPSNGSSTPMTSLEMCSAGDVFF